MTAATDTLPALPEPNGYIGACNHYCMQPEGSPLMPEKFNRWTAHQMRAYGDQRAEQERERCARLVEKKAAKEWIGVDEMADAIRSQGAIARTHPTPAQIEALAHRMCWRYKHSSDPAQITYTFTGTILLEFVHELLRGDNLIEKE